MISYAGAVLGVVTTVFLFPNILLPEEYGLTRILISFATLGAHLASLGIRGTIIRFMPLVGPFSERRHVFIRLVVFIPLVGFVVFLGLFLFAGGIFSHFYGDSPLFLDYRAWVLPLTFYILYHEVFNSFLRANQDSLSGSVTNEIGLRLVIIGLLGLYHYGWIDLGWFIGLFTGAYGLMTLTLGVLLLFRGQFRTPLGVVDPLSAQWERFPGLLKSALGRYSGFTFLGGIAGLTVANFDVLMISSYTGLADSAIYSISFFICSVMVIPLRAMERIGTPIITLLIRRKRWDDLRNVYQETSLNSFVVSFGVAFLIWLNLDMIYSFMPEIYSQGRWVVFWIGLGRMFDVAAGLNGSVLVTSKYYRADLWMVFVLLGLTVGTNLLLIPIYGVVGAAIATFITIVTYNLLKLIYVYVKMDQQPFSRRFLGLLAVLAPLVAGIDWLPLEGVSAILVDSLGLGGTKPWALYVQGVLKSALFVVLYGLLYFFMPASKGIKQKVRTMLAERS